MDLHAIVRHYIAKFRARSAEELDSFRREPTLAAAVQRAAMAEKPDGKRYSHQTRLKRPQLTRAAELLSGRIDELGAVTNFARLFSLVSSTLRPISGLGELYLYDTALRIGAKRDLLPDRVYLHAGTREGAKVLGLDPSAAGLHRFELPEALRELEMHEVEDVLCIYKAQLAGASLDLEDAEACWPKDEEAADGVGGDAPVDPTGGCN